MSTLADIRRAERANLVLGLTLVRLGRLVNWLLSVATAVAVVTPFWWVASKVIQAIWG